MEVTNNIKKDSIEESSIKTEKHISELGKDDFMSEVEFIKYLERNLDTLRHENDSIDDLLDQAIFKSVAEANNISIPSVKEKIKANSLHTQKGLEQRIQNAKKSKDSSNKEKSVSKSLTDKQR